MALGPAEDSGRHPTLDELNDMSQAVNKDQVLSSLIGVDLSLKAPRFTFGGDAESVYQKWRAPWRYRGMMAIVFACAVQTALRLLVMTLKSNESPVFNETAQLVVDIIVACNFIVGLPLIIYMGQSDNLAVYSNTLYMTAILFAMLATLCTLTPAMLSFFRRSSPGRQSELVQLALVFTGPVFIKVLMDPPVYICALQTTVTLCFFLCATATNMLVVFLVFLALNLIFVIIFMDWQTRNKFIDAVTTLKLERKVATLTKRKVQACLDQAASQILCEQLERLKLQLQCATMTTDSSSAITKVQRKAMVGKAWQAAGTDWQDASASADNNTTPEIPCLSISSCDDKIFKGILLNPSSVSSGSSSYRPGCPLCLL